MVNLTKSQEGILRAFWRHATRSVKPMTIVDLGHATGANGYSVGSTMGKLVKMGLATRTKVSAASPGDCAVSIYDLTDAGKAVLVRLINPTPATIRQVPAKPSTSFSTAQPKPGKPVSMRAAPWEAAE